MGRAWLTDGDAGNGNLKLDITEMPKAVATAAGCDRRDIGNKKRRGFLTVALCTVLSVGLVVGSLSVLSPAVAHAPNGLMCSLGPIDTLGQKSHTLQSLMESSADDCLPYNKDAVLMKRRNEVLASNMRNEPVIHANADSISEQPPELMIEMELFDERDVIGVTEQPVIESPVVIPGAEPVSPNVSYGLSEAEIQRRDQELINQKIAESTNAKVANNSYSSREWMLAHPQKNAFRSVVVISGEVIPMINDRNRCPDKVAGVWRGANSVTDNKGMYVLGHNPGVFHNLIDKNYRVGSTFTVWDEQGDGRVYTVTDTFIVPVGTQFDTAHQARTINSGGECVVLQTCIDNSTRYKIFVAH